MSNNDQMTITEFLEARINEDEALARAFVNGLGEAKRWRASEIGGELHQVGTPAFGLSSLLATFGVHCEAEFVAAWDPARVLAECAAKRAIVAMAPDSEGYVTVGDWDSCSDYCPSVVANAAIRALAAAYKDHPDYREEWA